MCELTILIPCLNEAGTLPDCIHRAMEFLSENNVAGEVLVIDNGSTDGSAEIASREGARVIIERRRGYGSALITGCRAAQGTYVIMGDADCSYDLLHLMPFLENLRNGYDLVMGNRYVGGIEKGAMPLLHRCFGTPLISFLGRMIYGSSIGDFNCGLRGYRREAILGLGLRSTGMEYASEMIIRSELANLRICEVPTVLMKDGRTGSSHLRSVPDGIRHVAIMLRYAPQGLIWTKKSRR